MKPIYGLLALAVLLLLIVTSAANADAFLSGVVSYGADASGSSVTEPGEFDNLPPTGNFEIVINGQPRGTTFALSQGPNNFTFSGVAGNYNALSLYFAPSGTPFNRPFGSVPDLVGYTDLPVGTVPHTPAPGSQVQTNGQFSGTVPWSGAAVSSDGFGISFTGFTFNSSLGSGTFQLTVAPEPTLTASLAVAWLVGRRHRRQKRRG